MKKTILKTAAFCLVVALNLTGCHQKIEGGVQLPKSSIVEKNAETKLYYEDTNNAAIREDLKNFVEFLNEQDEIRTNFIPTNVEAPENLKHVMIDMDRMDFKFIKNDNNKTLKLNFLMDSSTNSIVVDKKYGSADEVCSDYLTLVQFLFEKVDRKTDLLDKIGSSSFIYLDAKAMRDGILKFTSKKEVVRMIIADYTKNAFVKAGYTIVNNPSEADISIYFQISRDYYQSELKKLKAEGKTPKFGVVNAGLSNQIDKMNIGMNLASTSVSSGASAGVALGVGLVFAILDINSNKNLIIPTIKIVKEKERKSYFYIPLTFTHIYSNVTLGGDGLPYLAQTEKDRYFYRIREITEGDEKVYRNEIK